jgi:hypothetical protein
MKWKTNIFLHSDPKTLRNANELIAKVVPPGGIPALNLQLGKEANYKAGRR